MCSQEAAWLEQQEALLAMQAALPVQQPIYTSRAARKTRTPELDDAESQQYSPYPRFSRCASGCMQDVSDVLAKSWLYVQCKLGNACKPSEISRYSHDR